MSDNFTSYAITYDVSIDIYQCYQLLKVMAHLMRNFAV